MTRARPYKFAMSALPPKADIAGRDRDVRFVPKADIDHHSGDVRYYPESGHKAFMSTRPRGIDDPPKLDGCRRVAQPSRNHRKIEKAQPPRNRDKT
jgi:hypothetical protein